MYVVTLSVFHNLAIWLLYVNKPEPELNVLQLKNVVHTFGKLNNQYVTSCGLMLS